MTQAWRRIGRHAASILLGQLATIGFGVADTVMAGRYASEDLAALSIGAALYISLYVGLSGVVQSLIPTVGHHHGAHAPLKVGHVFRQGVYLALGVSIPGMLVMLFPSGVLSFADVTPEVATRAREYLGWLAWGLPLALLFRCYSGLNQGISRPLLVTLLQLIALAIKVPLNAWFIFGGAGLPPQGAVGCAMATLLINACLTILAAAMLAGHPVYRPFRLWQGWSWPHRATLAELLRLGVPTGASYFVEVTAFALMALFISHFGTVALAGHQIIANLASVVYMLPLSIAVATGACVAQLRGAGHHAEAAAAGWQGIGLSVGLSTSIAALLYLVRDVIVAAYSPDPQVQAAALRLFAFIVLYQVFDAAQVAIAFCLRSFRVAILPALAYVVSLWGLGLGGGYVLGFDATGHTPALLQGANGFWFANAAALCMVASALMLIYRRVSRQPPSGS